MKFTYELGDALYINLTNRCTNNCSFCIRNAPEGVGYDLWLQKEPTAEDIIDEIKDPSRYKEIVFCGYGEPLVKLKEIIETAKHLKKLGTTPLRINTNGHGNLIWGRNIVPELMGLIDAVSISLNAKDSEQYQALCRSDYGEAAYQAVLDFACDSVGHFREVWLTVVDVISARDIELCRKKAEEIGARFRMRHYQ